jgi:hypothetical protein
MLFQHHRVYAHGSHEVFFRSTAKAVHLVGLFLVRDGLPSYRYRLCAKHCRPNRLRFANSSQDFLEFPETRLGSWAY